MKKRKTILIMRHAKSSWDDSSQKDFDRPLNKRGRKDAPAMGKYLWGLGLIPGHIISSPAQRARETILKVSDAVGVKENIIQWNENLYYEGVEAYLKAIRSTPSAVEIVLVAGHNPTVEQTVAKLSGGAVRKAITTANIACFLSSAENWSEISERNSEFKWLRSPKEL